MGARVDAVPRWLKATVWSLAIGLALVGLALAVALGNVWPLVAFLGLAVAMIPVGTLRTTRGAARPSR